MDRNDNWPVHQSITWGLAYNMHVKHVLKQLTGGNNCKKNLCKYS